MLAFVNISVIGLVAMPSAANGRFVDSNAPYDCARENEDLVVGVKVRGSRNAFGEDNTAQPVWMAVAAGARRAAGDHARRRPPAGARAGAGDLRAGDMVTHCLKGQPVTRLTDHRGVVKPAVLDARQRGVLFDVGHGSGSFSWTVARQLAEQGFWPDTISTDVHTSSIKAPISIDMPATMSRLMHLGMSLEGGRSPPARSRRRGRSGGTTASAPCAPASPATSPCWPWRRAASP